MTKLIKAAAGSKNIHAASNALIAGAVAKGTTEVISTPAAATKADKARAVFTESYSMDPVPARKDIINRAVTEAGLTKAGAATYLQNFKAKNGLVASKAAAPAA